MVRVHGDTALLYSGIEEHPELVFRCGLTPALSHVELRVVQDVHLAHLIQTGEASLQHSIHLVFDWLTDLVTQWLAVSLFDLLTHWLTIWLTDSVTGCLVDLLTDWLIDWLIDWLVDFMDRLVDWWIGWLSDWLINVSITCPCILLSQCCLTSLILHTGVSTLPDCNLWPLPHNFPHPSPHTWHYQDLVVKS